MTACINKMTKINHIMSLFLLIIVYSSLWLFSSWKRALLIVKSIFTASHQRKLMTIELCWLIFPFSLKVLKNDCYKRKINTVVNFMSLGFYHPHIVICIFPSAFCHPYFIICTLSSLFFHPHFTICIFPSAICDHLVNSLQRP